MSVTEEVVSVVGPAVDVVSESDDVVGMEVSVDDIEVVLPQEFLPSCLPSREVLLGREVLESSMVCIDRERYPQ